jgi:predicted anti-sigma-YlaC factor YlaD
MALDKLSCKEVVGLVTDYLEAALLPPTLAQFEEHLGDCPGCRTYLQQIRQTIAMLHQLAEGPMFPENREALLQIFQTWKNAPPLSGE